MSADELPISENPEIRNRDIFRKLKRRYNETGNLSPFEDDVRRAAVATPVHIEEIHAETRAALNRELNSVSRGEGSRVVVLAGSNGVGKTHLVQSFARHSGETRNEGEPEYVFISPTDIDSASDVVANILDYLLEALTGQRRKGTDGFTTDRLEEKLQAIASYALRELAKNPERIQRTLLSRGFAGRWTHVAFRLGFLRNFRAKLANGDTGALSWLDPVEFGSFAADLLLEHPKNPLHRLVLQVLLRYLIQGERHHVLHWLRRRNVRNEAIKDIESDLEEKKGSEFSTDAEKDAAIRYVFKTFDVEERSAESVFQRFEIVRILCGLFTKEVERALKPTGDDSTDDEPVGAENGKTQEPRSLVFVFAYDQLEARDRFRVDDENRRNSREWQRFFAYLSVFYNTLPNVLVLCTMPLDLRNELFDSMEGQFKDRLSRDEEFVLTSKPPDETLITLYRKRLQAWLGNDSESALPEEMRYAPFDRSNAVLSLAHGENPNDEQEPTGRPSQTLRDVLENWDKAFATLIEEAIGDPIDDFDVKYKQVERSIAEGTKGPWASTHDHVKVLIDAFGYEMFRRALVPELSVLVEAHRDIDGTYGNLILRFIDQSGPKRFTVKVHIVHFQYGVSDTARTQVFGLTENQDKKRFRLWLIRADNIENIDETKAPRPHLVRKSLLSYRDYLTVQAAVTVAKNHTNKEDEADAETFIADKLSGTYLAQIVREVRSLIETYRREETSASDASHSGASATTDLFSFGAAAESGTTGSVQAETDTTSRDESSAKADAPAEEADTEGEQ